MRSCRTRSVHPKDVSMAQPTSALLLTVVTCYPFYFLGGVPQGSIDYASVISFGPTK